MISSESLKGKVKHIAKSKRLSSQEVLQMFFFERVLERLSNSRYKLNFVIKGGLLISSMIGIDNRTTMDLDTTVKGFPLKKEIIKDIMLEILSIEVNDGIEFKVMDITNIRDEDKYENFRVHLTAVFGKIRNTMKIDITTGDVITPKEIEYVYPCMFKEAGINVLAYPIETILAEKYESIIKRNISTTRMRDFYDLYTLYHLRKEEIDSNSLKKAILSTAEKRGSISLMQEVDEIIKDIVEDSYLEELWKVYLKDNPYITELKFKDTLEVVKIIAEMVGKN